MNQTPVCQRCGTVHVNVSIDGFCATCLLRSVLSPGPDESSAPLPSPALPRPFGAYELLEEIARGGMGVVYKARQVALNRTVALKVLLGGAYSSESLLRRFQSEAEAAAALQHPGIVAIHEFGECEDQPYYTMDYVEGRNLSQVAGGQPLAPQRAARYLRAIAEAVSFAHAQGILHRDLKPSNVLIDQDDRPRVTDFGLAKRLHGQADATLTGQMMGSPNYASPEQAAGRASEIGVASDIYSLGALLYNLLTGRPPFLAGTVAETLRLAFETEAIAPRTLNPAIPRDLETICLKCLEKSPARRFASAQELVDELDRFLRSEPIRSRPVSRPEQIWRWSRRHPALTGLAATIVAALSVTSVVFYTSASRIERARVKAEANLYAANMLIIGTGLTSAVGTDLAHFRALLAATRPAPDRPEFRGFEWRYYWSRSQGNETHARHNHAHVVDAVQFSPDGARVATQSRDQVLKLWDAASKNEIRSLDQVSRLGGFDHNGRVFFSRADRAIWRHDPATGETLRVRAPTGDLLGMTPDGRHAVILDARRTPVLRALGEEQAPAEDIPPAPPGTCAVVSGDGRRAALALPFPKSPIRIFELATGREIAVLVDPRPVIALALSYDGTQLASSGFIDPRLKLWDVDRGEQRGVFDAFLDPVWALAFSRDGRFVGAGGHNYAIKLYDLATQQEVALLRGHESTVRAIAFAPDGQQLASGGEDEMTMFWPARAARAPEEMRRLLRGPEWSDLTPSLSFSPDSRLFAGTAADGTVKVWRTDTIECLATFPTQARTVAFSPDGKSVLSESYDGVARRWPLQGAEQPLLAATRKPSFANWQVDRLTPAERVAMVAEQADTRAKCGLCEIPSARDGINAGAILSTPTIAMSPDARTMFLGLPEGVVEARDVATGALRFSFPAHKLNVSSIAVSADGKHLATGSLDNTTKLWDATTGGPLATFRAHNRPVWALAFSPDGQTLASGSCDKAIILCSVPLRMHVTSLTLYVGLPERYEQEIRLLRFSPDGNILAATLGDGTVRFFRAAPFSETDAKPAGHIAQAL